MLNEVKHPGRAREVSIASEETYGGHPGAPGFASAQDDNHHMTSDIALTSGGTVDSAGLPSTVCLRRKPKIFFIFY